MYMIVYVICFVFIYICAFGIRAQEYNIMENSKGKIKYDGWRKTKKDEKYINIFEFTTINQKQGPIIQEPAK